MAQDNKYPGIFTLWCEAFNSFAVVFDETQQKPWTVMNTKAEAINRASFREDAEHIRYLLAWELYRERYEKQFGFPPSKDGAIPGPK